jgi:hypothetical protein
MPHMLKLLGYLVQDNAATYTQERETAAWTAAYYLETAQFHLRHASANLTDLLFSRITRGRRAELEKLLQRTIPAPRSTLRELQNSWDEALAVFKVIVTAIAQR